MYPSLSRGNKPSLQYSKYFYHTESTEEKKQYTESTGTNTLAMSQEGHYAISTIQKIPLSYWK